jgi:hypothetical protein
MVDYKKLNQVPSEEDLDRIKEKLEYQDGEYSDAELLEYSIEKEKFNRNNRVLDYDTGLTGTFISSVSGVGVGIFTSTYTGNLSSGLFTGVGTTFSAEYGLKRAKWYLDKPKDEDKEKAIRDKS